LEKPRGRIRNEGKIRLVALFNVTQEVIERARKIVPVQNRYGLADRECGYVVNYSERNGITLIPGFQGWQSAGSSQ